MSLSIGKISCCKKTSGDEICTKYYRAPVIDNSDLIINTSAPFAVTVDKPLLPIASARVRTSLSEPSGCVFPRRYIFLN